MLFQVVITLALSSTLCNYAFILVAAPNINHKDGEHYVMNLDPVSQIGRWGFVICEGFCINRLWVKIT
jgi:hypothetical protein